LGGSWKAFTDCGISADVCSHFGAADSLFGFMRAKPPGPIPHTDDVGRLRETTLRRSPLRYAFDWRQDISTAPAALRMTSSTTSGFDNMGTCEDATSVVAAFMRFETKRCRSGGTVWSWVARTYQLGLAFHAVPSIF